MLQASRLQDQDQGPQPARPCRRGTSRATARRRSSLLCPLSSDLWTPASTWWSQRGGPTRPHSELGRETPPRPGYCPKRGGRAGRRQVEPGVQRSEIRGSRQTTEIRAPRSVPSSAAVRPRRALPLRPSPAVRRTSRPASSVTTRFPIDRAQTPHPGLSSDLCPQSSDPRGVEQSGSSSGS
jgi:hypothetical protein